MTRWKAKASRMVNRPNEKDQINMIIKNLLPAYNSKLFSSPVSLFGELCDSGTRIEDIINNGQLEKGGSNPQPRKVKVTFSQDFQHIQIEKGICLNHVDEFAIQESGLAL